MIILNFIKKIVPLDLRYPLKKIFYKCFKRKQFASASYYQIADQTNKYIHILEAINYIKVSGQNLVFYEFGNYSGRTLSEAINAAEFLNLENPEFFCFDSFKGLPKTANNDESFKESQFSFSKSDLIKIVRRRTGKILKEKNIIEGFYKDSLTKQLGEQIKNPTMVHIDVDLYSSTVEILEFLKNKMVPGAVFLFDDWYCYNMKKDNGEKLALQEFLKKNSKYEFIEWKNYSTFGKSFFIRVKE